MATFIKAAVPSGAYTLPRQYYVAEDVFQAERERIFLRQWVCVGRAEQLQSPGDYFLTEIGGESLIVVRGREGELRAFFNVCRHRGTRMCTEASGHFAGSIQCPYHAWTYALDGQLIAARYMRDTAGFDQADYPLHQVALAEWEGFILLNLAPEPEPFERAFAPLIAKFTRWDMPHLRLAQRIEYDVQANWKMIFQNYSECYHCSLIHPALVQLSPPRSGRNDLTAGPFLGGYMDLRAAAESLTVGGHTGRPPLGEVRGADLRRVYYYSIFPNMLLSLHPDYAMAHTLWPLAPGRTRIVCEWYFDPATLAQPIFDPSDAVEFWDMTNRQDWHVCELSQ
ncbi:MAG TPA: aromatic ring-hydroxylating dioxygenase subunit alpha, partial [Roseiflexaceae bacterium]|nr:aromatic ring-hydroxylating dioxygenase subunit alpha [Roseiflexaceae bacterium]